MAIPCRSKDDACSCYPIKTAANKERVACRYRLELDKGYRTEDWVTERCETLAARAEGFVEVDKIASTRPDMLVILSGERPGG